jgi:hypothetical protein
LNQSTSARAAFKSLFVLVLASVWLPAHPVRISGWMAIQT